MKFWDASAIVPLLVDQAATAAVARLWREDATALVWWATPVECASALGRLLRDRAIGLAERDEALRRLAALASAWYEVEPSPPVRVIAERLLGTHPLRAADALQLAAAVFFRQESGTAIPFVSFDGHLAAAARSEHLPTLGVESA